MSAIEGVSAPAGWYQDPYARAELRWWDGTSWTDAEHNPFAPVASAPVDSAPVEPASVEPASVTPAPMESALTDSAPVESALLDPAAVPSGYPVASNRHSAAGGAHASTSFYPSLGAVEETVPMSSADLDFDDLLAAASTTAAPLVTAPLASVHPATAEPVFLEPMSAGTPLAAGAPVIADSAPPGTEKPATIQPDSARPDSASVSEAFPAALPQPAALAGTGPILSAPRLAELPPPTLDEDDGYTWDREVEREERATLLAPTVSAATSVSQFFGGYQDQPTRRATLSAYLLGLSPFAVAGAAAALPHVLEAFPSLLPETAPWWLALSVVGGLLYFLGIMLAVADRAGLLHADHERPATAAWAALTAPVYLLARTIAVRRETGAASSPLYLWLVCALLVALGGYYLSLVDPQYLSGLADLWVR